MSGPEHESSTSIRHPGQGRITKMDTITSTDGTRIAYQRGGEGPPLVLVHGTAADHSRWRPVFPALEGHFTAYAIDRRGRGESGDAEGYALEPKT
jgi:pimeloyl-ACP methyl ester carboxylesterase